MKVHRLSDGAGEKPGKPNRVPQNPARKKKAFAVRYCDAVQKHLAHGKKRP
jgi:hypothetical protein